MTKVIRGRLLDLTLGLNNRQQITVEVRGDYRDLYQSLIDKEIDITISEHVDKRSKNANAYFHVLLNKLTSAMSSFGINESDEALKRKLVVEYGVVAKDEHGNSRGFKLPARDNPTMYWKYVRCFDTRDENGTLFNCYICYKRTRDMNVREMCRLIDGLILEIKDFNQILRDDGKPEIVTDTPEQLAKFREEWLANERH